MRFRPGTRWRSLQWSPVPVDGLRGLLLREREVELTSKRIEGKGREEEIVMTLSQQRKSNKICSAVETIYSPSNK